MTPFMWKVQELLDGEIDPSPETLPAETVTVAQGADTQVIIRSLAEQLVCEANAVIAWADEPDALVTLVDETGPGALAFTLAYRDRSARIQTVFTGHTAVASLIANGSAESRQLKDEDQVESLVLELIGGPTAA